MTVARDVQERVAAIAAAVRERCTLQPEVALVLGSGLGGLADEIDTTDGLVAPYGTLPGFPLSTAPGHAGRLVLGKLAGKTVLAFQGRVHAYEGYAPREVVIPILVARALGAETLIVTNACGGLNPNWRAGDLMLQLDFINMTGLSPLIGPNDTEIGPRFPVMFDAYDEGLNEIARRVARAADIQLREGVYLAITGPAYATRAELRAFRTLGADTIGMSTVHEVLAARHAGMKVLGLSAVTDMALPDSQEHADEQEVIRSAARTGPRFASLLKAVLASA
jgi:purine-nucleoside phosphorylase